VLQDGLFLTLVVLLSCSLYTSRLGFYSDDWVFLSLLKGTVHHSPAGWYQALYAGDVVIRQRPAQIVYLAMLYGFFGLQPFGYHLANALMLVAGSLFFYLSLRVLQLSRLLALALPLIYILLPNYSTDRFWIAAHQATLSIVFYFISLYADLKAVQDYPLHLRRWKSISILSLVISGLAYEVTLPLFLMNPLLAWYLARQKYRTQVKKNAANTASMIFNASHPATSIHRAASNSPKIKKKRSIFRTSSADTQFPYSGRFDSVFIILPSFRFCLP
jgi:hypothetical protein